MHDVLSFNLNSYESKIFDFPFLLFFIPTYLSGFNDLNMQSFGLIWLNFCKLLVCTLHEGINPLAPFLLLQSHLISYSRIIVYIYSHHFFNFSLLSWNLIHFFETFSVRWYKLFLLYIVFLLFSVGGREGIGKTKWKEGSRVDWFIFILPNILFIHFVSHIYIYISSYQFLCIE